MFTTSYISFFLGTILSFSLFTSCGSADVSQTKQNNTAQPTQTVAAKANEKAKENSEANKQNDLIEIFDGRKDLDYRDYSKEETQIVQTEFDRKKAEIKQKFGDKYCYEPEDENVTLNGVVEGSFTKPNSKQKAFLYTLCSSGSSHFGVGGILIFENEKAVSHYAYGENGLDQGMIALSDINKDGMDELVLLDFQMHQGYGGGAISIVSFPNSTFSFIGMATTYSDDSGAKEDEKDAKAKAFDISVQPNANPVFYRDTYEKKGTAKSWSQIKKGEKFTLNKLEAEFIQGYKKITL